MTEKLSTFLMIKQNYFQVKVVLGQPEEERGERDKTSKRYYGLVILMWLSRPCGYKTFFMLSSAETKIYPAHKC